MHLTTLEQDGVIVINLVGNLNIHSHTVLKKKVRELVLEEGATKILVDVTGIKQVDSTGLGTFVSLLNTIRENDGDLRFAGNFMEEVKQAFDLCGLSSVFIRYPNVKNGIKNFKL
ncbi:MAG TPA: STAS domain-containing protein [bacterium]|nr:STAS domain-containing protein [bacterium]